MKKFATILTLFALLLAVCGAILAQTSKGILSGTVRDTTGSVIANAKLTVTNEDTGETRTTTSSSIGLYRVEGINPGAYKLHIEVAGFEVSDVNGVRVLPSVVTTYDPKLFVGNVSVAVTVEADTNGVNLENGHLSSTIGTNELDKLPIFTLNPVELIATVPGAQYINDASTSLHGVGGQYDHVEINGARPRANNFMLDGQDINDIGLGGQAFQPLIPEMFQSIVTYTNNSPAEYGRAGGAVVNLITKAGTNSYHGSVFELYSGSGLNSVDGVTRVGSTSRSNKARYDQHQYGFTAGGPLWKDKLFAFGGTMFTRFYGNSNSNEIELPDAAGYATLTAIGGPQATLLKSLLSNGSYLTQYQLNSDNVEILDAGSHSGCPGGVCSVATGNFERPPVAQQEPDTQWFYRIDFIPSQKNTFGFRYLHDRNNFLPDLDLNTSGLPGFDGEVGGPTELASGNWTHVFTPNLLNELRASETRISFEFQPTPDALANPVATVFNVNFTDNGIPVLGLSQNMPQGTKEDAYQFQDTVGWTKGRQSLRIGVDVGRTLETLLVAQQPYGQLNFASDTNGSALANFLNNNLGVGGTAVKSFGPTRLDPHIWKSAFFVQDDVKLSTELTINLGLRYDYLTDPGNSLPYPGIDVSNPYAPITNVYKIQNDTKNIGPRFGFAYAPSNNGWLGQSKTVIHGGAGIYYDTSFSNIAINSDQGAPNAVSGTLNSTIANPLGNATGLIATIPSSLGPLSAITSGIDKNIVNPRTYEFNLGFERALPAQLKLTVNYVGSRSRKLYANQQYNYVNNSTPAAVAAGQRLNPARGVINVRTNTAASEYDSIQTDVARQFSHGLFFRATYTFGKNLDDGSEIFTTFASPTSYPANLAPGGRSQDWARSAFDFPHYFSLTYAWSPAGFHAENKMSNALLGGFTRNFTVSGITQFQSGPPSTFNVSGKDINHDGSTANDRPWIGNPHASVGTAGSDGSNLAVVKDKNKVVLFSGSHGVYYDQEYYNKTTALNAANAQLPTPIAPINPFKITTPDQVHWLIPYGGAEVVPFEIGRNSYSNPGTTVWNVAAEKDIPSAWTHLEKSSFQIRAEAQNVFNHNDVGVLDTNITHIGSGSTYLNPGNTRINTNRNVRFWAKFVF